MSVTASEWRYCFSVARVTASGTVWSLPPVISSSGPRFSLPVSTLAGECGLKLAAAASNSGLPGAGIVQRSYSASDSSLGDGVAEGEPELLGGQGDRPVLVRRVLEHRQGGRSADSGSGSTPLICAASIATAATARSCPSSFWAIMPPNECPIRIGRRSAARR